MKLVSVRVEHFRCIRTAKIEFGGGLNVLHGPNDLGKSSLAHAVRAALLLQSTATEHRDFVSWYDSEGPFVELVFESEPQRDLAGAEDVRHHELVSRVVPRWGRLCA